MKPVVELVLKRSQRCFCLVLSSQFFIIRFGTTIIIQKSGLLVPPVRDGSAAWLKSGEILYILMKVEIKNKVNLPGNNEVDWMR